MSDKFTLTPESYTILKGIDFSELGDNITFMDDQLSVEVTDSREFGLIILAEVPFHGMDDEDTVNAYGRKVYDLYDEILFQKHGAELLTDSEDQ